MTPAALEPWLQELLGLDTPPSDAEPLVVEGRSYVLRDGILRLVAEGVSSSQDQTSEAFGFKWQQSDSFESEAVMDVTREHARDRYGDVVNEPWWGEYGERPVVVDAGCGAGVTALAMLGPILDRIHYIGVDLSSSVDVAAARFARRGVAGTFIQADMNAIPLPEGSVHFALAEGTLHHTDDTETAFRNVARLIAPGGRFAFYVYRHKAPIREFTDDYIRDRLQEMTPQEGWDAMLPLTKLGEALAELDVTVDVPEDVDLLGIPAGRHDVQRLIYWYVAKLYHRPEWSLEENNHVNYDWYAPRNAYRHSEDEVRAWCETAGLDIERECIQEAGITVVARRPD